MNAPAQQDQEAQAVPLSRFTKVGWVLIALVSSVLMIALGIPVLFAIGWCVLDVLLLAWLSRRASAPAEPRGPSGLT